MVFENEKIKMQYWAQNATDWIFRSMHNDGPTISLHVSKKYTGSVSETTIIEVMIKKIKG